MEPFATKNSLYISRPLSRESYDIVLHLAMTSTLQDRAALICQTIVFWPTELPHRGHWPYARQCNNKSGLPVTSTPQPLRPFQLRTRSLILLECLENQTKVARDQQGSTHLRTCHVGRHGTDVFTVSPSLCLALLGVSDDEGYKRATELCRL